LDSSLITIIGLCYAHSLKLKTKNENLRKAVATKSRGVYKRIDENRELLELLQGKAPELLQEHFYIEGWLAGHDQFFTEVALLAETPNTIGMMNRNEYPRPWPGNYHF